MSITPTPAYECPSCRCELVFVIRELADACPMCRQLWEWDKAEMRWKHLGELKPLPGDDVLFEDEQSYVPYETREQKRRRLACEDALLAAMASQKYHELLTRAALKEAGYWSE